MEATILIIVLAIGVVFGYVIHSLRKTKPDNAELEALAANIGKSVSETNLKSMIEAANHLREQSSSDFQQRQKSIESLVNPIKEAIDKTERYIQTIEKERKQDQGSLVKQLEIATSAQLQLQKETGRLVNALKTPHVRGRWGEITLRRTVELAGMRNHCDFEEQPQTISEEGRRLRPDMIINLPRQRRVVVDAKTPLDAYLASLETDDEESRKKCLQQHAQQLATHVKALSSKAYWQQFENTLDFIVMFVPGEQFLTAALEHQPNLQENALSRRIILATPPTLVALLRVIHYGWQQESLTKNAQEIRRSGEELYHRIATFTEHLAKIGKTLGSSVTAYNAAVGSLQKNLLPGARKLVELGIPPKKQIPDMDSIESTTREIISSGTTEPEDKTTNEP